MKEDGVGLRERMRSLTVAELRRIAANHTGDHHSDEVGAANEELTLRFSALRDGPLEVDRGTGDVSMPVGLRIVFYLASCAALLEIFALVFFASVLVTANASPRVLIEVLLKFGLPAAWAMWIAAAIRSERRYVRGLLLVLLSVAITVRLTRAILTQQFTYGNWIILGTLAAAFCYIAFSGAVRSYYSAMGDV